MNFVFLLYDFQTFDLLSNDYTDNEYTKDQSLFVKSSAVEIQ
jgi:hypothetical protein